MRGLALIVALAAATSVDAQAHADTAAVTAELDDLDRRWQGAFMRGDADVIRGARWCRSRRRAARCAGLGRSGRRGVLLRARVRALVRP